MTIPTPTLLFGAFDRHNFGDMLFPHVVAALLPGRPLLFAGLAERDLTPWGGHRVRAMAALAAELADRPLDLIHVGGELLTCDRWQAAVMLLPPAEVQATLARLERKPQQRAAWVRAQLGLVAEAPYSVSRRLFPQARRVVYNSVGGVGLDARPAALRGEVLANLRAADAVGVRDRSTLAQLAAADIAAQLLPDPAVMVAELFGARLQRCGAGGAVAEIVKAFPAGYLAVQFSADFGDDATLSALAAQLERIATQAGCAIVLFRAGAAPWHDELECYRRLAARMPAAPPLIFEPLDIWEICALIAHSRGYCGSSLHGRIVAMACAVPRVNLLHDAQRGEVTKQAAYAATWELAQLPGAVGVAELAAGMERALAVEREALQPLARALAARYRAAFAQLMSGRGGC